MTDTAKDTTLSYIIYDLCIEDVHQRRQQGIVMHGLTGTAEYLGVVPSTVKYNLTAGRRLYSKTHQKHFAVRIYQESKQLANNRHL